ncbi:c-type cytochrome [Bradyrhizobium jicamae]|uniref:c-type cytochrome n=1 Tax=Bradyrhizobium jicamae TaxID=280332 RepID=UPI0020114B47|nr:c-type cytochrome [Bradyrhizobium jicamae]
MKWTLVLTLYAMGMASPSLAQEPRAGEQAFNNSCRTCHTVKEGDNRAGPSLHAIVGRKAGTVPNFAYTEAMKSADFVWDEDKLARFIEDPEAMVSGNRMKPYTGVRSAEDRAKIVAFLKSSGP